MTNISSAMLHLAQVHKNPASGKMELQLLAQQQSESTWKLSNGESFPLTPETDLGEGALVLVERGDNNQIVDIQTAKEWILGILQQYLTENAIDSQFVEIEQSKIEQWRQEITTQSLELNRRSLEIETRREQIQELEQTLKQDKENLARQREELQKLADTLEQERAKLKLNLSDEA